jgi:hypothetical protein
VHFGPRFLSLIHLSTLNRQHNTAPPATPPLQQQQQQQQQQQNQTATGTATDSNSRRMIKNSLQKISGQWTKSIEDLKKKKKNPEKESKPKSSSSSNPSPSYARAMRYWDVQIPPPRQTMAYGGYMVPRVDGTLLAPLLRQKRRISLEIHHVGTTVTDRARNTQEKEGKAPSSDADPALLQRHLRGKSLKSDGAFEKDHLDAGEYIVVRVLQPNENEEESTATKDEKELEERLITEFRAAGDDLVDDFGGKWTELTCADLDDVSLVKTRGKYCHLKLGRGDETEIRVLQFASLDHADSFVRILRKLGRLEAQRTQQRVEQYLATKKKEQNRSEKKEVHDHGHEHEGIHIVVEIVSAINLPKASIVGSDPYVAVRMGSREVHCTKTINNRYVKNNL